MNRSVGGGVSIPLYEGLLPEEDGSPASIEVDPPAEVGEDEADDDAGSASEFVEVKDEVLVAEGEPDASDLEVASVEVVDLGPTRFEVREALLVAPSFGFDVLVPLRSDGAAAESSVPESVSERSEQLPAGGSGSYRVGVDGSPKDRQR